MFPQLASQGPAAFWRGPVPWPGPIPQTREKDAGSSCYHGAEGGRQLVDAARRRENEHLVAQRLGQLAEHELQDLPVGLLQGKGSVRARLHPGRGDGEFPSLKLCLEQDSWGGP